MSVAFPDAPGHCSMVAGRPRESAGSRLDILRSTTRGVRRLLRPRVRPLRDEWRAPFHGRRSALPVGAWLLLVATFCPAAGSAAPVPNLPICTTPLSQDLPQIIPDGSGGVIITWQTTTTSGVKGIFAQRIDREDHAAWGENGVAVCPLPADQQRPMLVPDSSGGAIVVWQDYRSGNDWDVFAQRIDRSGTLRWPRAGVPISSAASDQLGPEVASDGHGGALVAWRDLREDPSSDLYAQAIDGTGQVRWSTSGIPISAGPGAQLVSQVVMSGAGGVFVWRDSLGDGAYARIHAQRVDAMGNPLWGPGGLLLDDGAAPDAHPVSVADGRGGLVVAWESGPIHAQRLDVSGRRLWGDDGIVLSTADGSAPSVLSDGDGGVTVAWQTRSFDDEASDIRAQSVRASGTPRWGPDGIAVCEASGAQTEVVAAQAAAGGAIVMWRDARSDPFGDLCAQRVDSSGTALWKADGIVVSDAPGFQSALTICSDGLGGAVAAWTDGRAGRHIYAQRVSPQGRPVGHEGTRPAKPPDHRGLR